MHIDDKLNLVLPFGEDGQYVYHTPISKEVFERNYRGLAAVKAELASKGTHYQMLTGPQIAALALKDEFRANAPMNEDGEPDERESKAFFAELARLTMVLVPNANGNEKMPVDAAIRSDKIDEDEWHEVESSIVFFTAHLLLTKKAQRKAMTDASASLLGGFVTSSPISEWADFLPKLTNQETSEQTPASSVPV